MPFVALEGRGLQESLADIAPHNRLGSAVRLLLSISVPIIRRLVVWLQM